MTDTDLMPFGMYKGKMMKDVPSEWFAWFKSVATRTAPNKRPLSHKEILKYIKEKK